MRLNAAPIGVARSASARRFVPTIASPRAEWDDFLNALFRRWGGRWLNEEAGTSGGGR